jgi:hypothetical protein
VERAVGELVERGLEALGEEFEGAGEEEGEVACEEVELV